MARLTLGVKRFFTIASRTNAGRNFGRYDRGDYSGDARRLALGVNGAITLGSVITPYRKPDRNADLRSAETQGRKTPI